MRNFLTTTILGAAFAASATLASAATVTPGGFNFAPGPVDTPAATTGTVFVGVTGSVGGLRADPWAGGPFAGVGEYTSVSGGASATYTYATARDSIDLLWGTPDSYNSIQFFSGGVLVDSITGANTGIPDFDDQTTNEFVTVTASSLFDSVTYLSGSNAFEFATVAPVAPVPLPAAGLLLVGAMGGLAAMKRRRKA